MLIGIVSTVTAKGIVGIYSQQHLLFDDVPELIGEETFCVQRGGHELAKALIQLLKHLSIPIQEVTAWYLNMGPGSFTGIRAAMGFYLGISRVTGSRLYGFEDDLAILAQWEWNRAVLSSAMDLLDTCAILHDGRRDEVIRSIWSKKAGKWEPIEPKKILKLEELVDSPLSKVLIRKDDPLYQRVAEKISMDSWEPVEIQGKGLAKALTMGYIRDKLEPLYIRPPVFVDPLLPYSP